MQKWRHYLLAVQIPDMDGNETEITDILRIATASC